MVRHTGIGLTTVAPLLLILAACQPAPSGGDAIVANPQPEVLSGAPGVANGQAVTQAAGPTAVERECAAQNGVRAPAAGGVPTGDADALANYQACVAASGPAAGSTVVATVRDL